MIKHLFTKAIRVALQFENALEAVRDAVEITLKQART